MKIKLEDLNRKDFQKIIDLIDPDIFHIFKPPVDDKQLNRLLTRRENGILLDLGMKAIDTETDETVGLIHAVINEENNYAHIQQIVVDPLKRRNGYATEMLSLFLDTCFKEYHFHRVQLFTDESNKPAISCYKKAGFHLDGIMRDAEKTENGYSGTFIFSILENEWEFA